MKVQELLINIKNKEFKLERGLEVKKYLPIEAKKTIAKGIIYDCTDDSEGVIKVDSVQRYMSYVRYMITTHTNLEYTDENYDALCSTEYGDTNLLNSIMDCFGDDAKECTRILNLMTDDLIYENSIEFTIGKFLNNINSSLGTLIGGFADKVNSFDLNNILPDGVNADQFTNILNLINKK
jgi:hypothetical protein